MELLSCLGIVHQNWRRGELLAVLVPVAVHQVHKLLRSIRVDVPAGPRVDQYQGRMLIQLSTGAVDHGEIHEDIGSQFARVRGRRRGMQLTRDLNDWNSPF